MTLGSQAPHPSTDPQLAKRKKNTYLVGIGTGIIFLLISVASTISTIETGLNAFGGIILTAIVALIGFLAAYAASRDKAALGSAVLVSSILLLSLSLPLLAKGQGVPLAILTVIIISSIGSSTLDNRWATRATVVSVIIGLLIIFADLFLPDFGIPNDPQITYIISAIAGAMYGIVILRRFGAYPLRIKLTIAFILITLIPIGILAAINNFSTRNILNDQADADLSNLAEEAALKIDTYIASELDTVRTEAQQPGLANYLQTPADDAARQTAQRTLLTFVRKDPVFILSYSLLAANGQNVLSTDQSQVGQDEKNFEYFTAPLNEGIPYISDLLFKSDYPTIYLTAPIRAENGAMLGVLRAEYYATVFQKIVRSIPIEAEAGQQLLLINRETLVRIAGTSEREQNYLSLSDLTPQQIADFQARQMLPFEYQAAASAPPAEFIMGLENLLIYPAFTVGTPGQKNSLVVVGRTLTTQPWVVTAQQPEATIYAQAETQARNNVLWALLLTGFAFMAAFMVSQIVSRPVISLADIAEEITQGNLTARATVTTDDEVGRLSQVFNTMTSQLSQTLADLEQRVSERTTALQAANQQSAQRARQLQSIADISRVVSREQSIDKLLPLITDVVSERFGYYHIGIFLLDETREAAVLQASNSSGGKKLVENGHRLSLGTGSIVGFVALTGKARIALDVGEDAVFFNNPYLPETHSEMALPLIVRGITIGIMDLQSKQSSAFTQEDVDTLSILADQVAIAIENARLFRQTQAALEESQFIVQTYLRQEWSAMSRRQATVGYLHSGTGGKALSAPIQAEEIEQARRQGTIIKKEGSEETGASPALAVPIKLGEQTLGAIRIQPIARKREWSAEELNLVRSISDRVSLALENARLIASSQKRASKERSIGEIAAKISAATDMDTILQIAVQEIGRTLSGTDVVIQLEESQEE